METGVELLTSTRKDWAGSILGGHINWHLTLYYLGEPTPRVVTGSPQTLPHGRLNYRVRIIISNLRAPARTETPNFMCACPGLSS